jgi:hypothetical protein
MIHRLPKRARQNIKLLLLVSNLSLLGAIGGASKLYSDRLIEAESSRFPQTREQQERYAESIRKGIYCGGAFHGLTLLSLGGYYLYKRIAPIREES